MIGTAEDNAGNTAEALVYLNIDKTLPTLISSITPTANGAGWHNDNVSISYTCADSLSGVTGCPAATSVLLESANQSIMVSIIDKADNHVTLTDTINIDKTGPVVTTSRLPAPNVHGWNNSDVTVSFACVDGLSGMASCPPAVLATLEGAAQTISGTGVDVAGNSTMVAATVNLDKTPPVLIIVSPVTGSQLTINPPAISLAFSDLSGVDTTSVNLTVNGTAIAADCQLTATGGTCTPTAALTGASVLVSINANDLAGNASVVSATYVIDSDNDGVADASDLCSGTAAGTTVDANGCSAAQLDADGDGVTDASDLCPGTATGATVDVNGCSAAQLDADADGVTDGSDLCPGTVVGATVDTNGCSAAQLDTDGDGVPNASDLCPSTVAGVTVEADGCDPTQRDTDGDGHIDIEDAFPTDATEWTDLDGDGIGDNADTDRDGDGVLNTTDLFPNNPAEWADINGDGIGDNADTDRDGDGVLNESDAYPNDPTRTVLPIITIGSPATLITVGSTPLQISGSVDLSAISLTVNGVPVTPANGAFSASVALEEGHNTVVARMVDGEGVTSTASISVSLDMTPPYITVESHTDGQTVYASPVSISGLINDIVRGTVEASQANVLVNGVQAAIANRSYLAENISLIQGENLITIQASDQVSNTAEISFTLNYQPPVGRYLEIASGQGQSALLGEVLPLPLSLRVLDDSKLPVVGKNVVFRVIQGAGVVGAGTLTEARGVLAVTDADGIAATSFKLGQRSGIGNHKVRARVVGYKDEVIFHASATAGIGVRLSVNSGNNQRGGVHQPLPAPYVVAVTDSGANVVKAARVKFAIVSGGGHFENDLQTITVVTDSDGRASVHHSLGGVEGLDQQRVTAILLDGLTGQTISAGFTASGFVPGDSGLTSISGVVMDNQDNPLPGVTVRVDGTTRQAVADIEGRFIITNVPVGPVHLIADGSTTTVGGEFPALSYNIVTVSGVENPLASPIYMVKLDTENAVYAGLEDVAVTLPEAPGFKLEISAGSVTFPDGSREGNVSVTIVNSSKVPMAPPNGMQPQFIVTIQPTGAMFDPPGRLTLPNVDAHPPGAQVEMYSYDHDLEEFVSIGLGTVSEDSLEIRSNPGVGVIKAGWHCGSQPGDSGCCGDCGECAEGCDCTPTPDKALSEQTPYNCALETCGGSIDDPNDTPEDDPNDCVDPVCDGPPAPDDGEKPDPSNDCKICQGGSSADAANGTVCNDECGACVNASCDITDPDKPKATQDPNDCKTLLCGGGFDPVDTEKPAIPDQPNDCKKPACVNGEPDLVEDPYDIPEDECKTCSGADEINKPDGSDVSSDVCLFCLGGRSTEKLGEIQGAMFICPGDTKNYSVNVNKPGALVSWGGVANSAGDFTAPDSAVDGDEFNITASVDSCEKSYTVTASDGIPGEQGQWDVCADYPEECWKLSGIPDEAYSWQQLNDSALGGGGGGGCSDAARHAYFNARATMIVGANITKSFSDGHEVSGVDGQEVLSNNDCVDNNMDLHNNSAGRVLGDGCATAACASTSVVNALKNGSLVYIDSNGGTVSTESCIVDPGSVILVN